MEHAVQLSKSEAETFAQAEATISSGLNSFLEVGNALMKIRDGKLYRNTHKTFALYLKERWGIQRAQGYRLIKSADTIRELNQLNSEKPIPLPSSERQIRILQKIKDPRKRHAVLLRAKELAKSETIAYRHLADAMREAHTALSERTRKTESTNLAEGIDAEKLERIGRLITNLKECICARASCRRELGIISELETLLMIHQEQDRELSSSDVVSIESPNSTYTIDCSTRQVSS